MLDDYSRSGGPPEFDNRGGGPPMKRQRLDGLTAGHWANAPTDRRGPGSSSMPSQAPHWRQNTNDLQSNSGNTVDETLDDTLTAARHGVSPFFQTATDEEMRGIESNIKSISKVIAFLCVYLYLIIEYVFCYFIILRSFEKRCVR